MSSPRSTSVLSAPARQSTSAEATRRIGGAASLQRARLAAVERFLHDLAPRMPVKDVPEVVLVKDLQGAAARYDEKTNRIFVPPQLLEGSGRHARKILIHEMVHAWQNQTHHLRWNLDEVGHYIEAPTGSLGGMIANPVKLAKLIGYALQPSELHAELSRMARQAFRAAPAAPW